MPANEVKQYAPVSSRETGLKQLHGLIVGKPGVGKTRTLATLSAFWDEPEMGKEWRKLEDFLIIPFDDGATRCFLRWKADVHEVPLQDMRFDSMCVEKGCACGLVNPTKFLNKVLDYVANAVSTIPRLKVGVDTGSSLDVIIRDWFESEEHGPKTSGDKKDTFTQEKFTTRLHERFRTSLYSFPCQVWYSMHLKSVKEDKEGNTRRTIEATALPGHVQTVIDVRYNNTRNLFRRHNDVCLLATKVGDEYKLIGDAAQSLGVEVKNRLQGLIGAVEKPNLGAIFRRIEKGLENG